MWGGRDDNMLSGKHEKVSVWGGEDNIIRMLRDGVAYTQLSTQIISLFG